LLAGGLPVLALAILNGCASTSHERTQAAPPTLVVTVEPAPEPLQSSLEPDEGEKPDDAHPLTDDVEPAPTGDVARYPDMIRISGTYVLNKTYHVYQAADLTSSKLTRLAPGILVNGLYHYGSWIMVDWPSGPGQLAPGWIHENLASPNIKRVDWDK